MDTFVHFAHTFVYLSCVYTLLTKYTAVMDLGALIQWCSGACYFLVAVVTTVVNDRQSGNSSVCEDRQRSDERCVWMDVGDVGIRPHTKLLQGLLHEGRHGHLTQLTHTHTQDGFTTICITMSAADK